MKIVLAGGYDTSNLGDHAMLHILKTSLDKYEETNITILARHLEKNIENDYNVRLVKNLDHDTKQESLGRWFNGFNLNDNTEHIQQISKELQSADALIIGGGRLFIDKCFGFMKGPLPYYVLLTIVAKFLNIPIIIYGMTIVEPKSDEGKEMLKFIIENANLVMIREDSSKNTLELLGIKNNNLHVIPDPAFALLPNADVTLAENIFQKEGLKNTEYIGINLRYTNLNNNIDNEAYYNKLVKFCDIIYEKYNKEILLISQMNYSTDNIFDDDRNLYKIIKDRSKYKNNIHIIQGKYNLFETLAIYTKIDMLFSMRRHGLIFAATQNIPVYGLIAEENTKYALIEMGLDNNSININNEFTEDIFNNLASIENTKEIQKYNIEKLSDKTLEYAKEIIKLVKETKNEK
jgi:colanic acid/amylovoran biosynthesis protein